MEDGSHVHVIWEYQPEIYYRQGHGNLYWHLAWHGVGVLTDDDELASSSGGGYSSLSSSRDYPLCYGCYENECVCGS